MPFLKIIIDTEKSLRYTASMGEPAVNLILGNEVFKPYIYLICKRKLPTLRIEVGNLRK